METIKTGKSNISLMPRGHYVILKAITSASTLMLTSGTPSHADQQESVVFEVAAYGDKVEGLELGDIVIAQGQADQILNVPENKQSKKELILMLNDKDVKNIIRTTPKHVMIEYVLYPEYNIVAKKI